MYLSFVFSFLLFYFILFSFLFFLVCAVGGEKQKGGRRENLGCWVTMH